MLGLTLCEEVGVGVVVERRMNATLPAAIVPGVLVECVADHNVCGQPYNAVLSQIKAHTPLLSS